MLVVVAPNIARAEVLLAGVVPGAEVLLLNEDEDSIAQISRLLAANPAGSLHLVCHGSYDSNMAQLHLGKANKVTI